MGVKEASAQYVAAQDSGCPVGYKQTEVGVIPADWVVKTIQEISIPVRGGSPRPAGDPKYFNGSFIPWLTVAALTNIPASELRVSKTATCLTEEGSLYSRTLLPGTLIIANSGATLGVAKILGIKCCANDGIAALLSLLEAISPFYLAHYINTKTSYLREVVATGNGQPNLNTNLVGSFKVPLPPTRSEQEAIARTLSDTDALIESLEQLIAKKHQIKQGAMQELLTGKRRLPGFSGGWEYVAMSSLGRVYGGLSGKTKANFGHGSCQYIPFMNVMSSTVIDSLWLEKVDIAPNESQQLVMKGDLFFNGSSETPEEVGFCAVLLDDIESLYLNSFCFGFRLSAVANGLFLAYWFRCREGRKAMAILAQGATRYNLSKRTFIKLLVPQPSVEEQQTIVTVLSDMDAEIASLETKLTKTRQLKQGMMHELLTGRIRLA